MLACCVSHVLTPSLLCVLCLMQLYRSNLNFLADCVSGGRELLVRGKKFMLIPAGAADASWARRLTEVQYKQPAHVAATRRYKQDSGWVKDAEALQQ